MGVLRGEKNVSKKNLFSGKRGAFHCHSAFLWAKELLAICRETILGSPQPYSSCSKSLLQHKLCHAVQQPRPGLCIFCSQEMSAVWVAQETLGHKGSPAMSQDCSPAGEKHMSPCQGRQGHSTTPSTPKATCGGESVVGSRTRFHKMEPP